MTVLRVNGDQTQFPRYIWCSHHISLTVTTELIFHVLRYMQIASIKTDADRAQTTCLMTCSKGNSCSCMFIMYL